jgi:hypothetical protein
MVYFGITSFAMVDEVVKGELNEIVSEPKEVTNEPRAVPTHFHP